MLDSLHMMASTAKATRGGQGGNRNHQYRKQWNDFAGPNVCKSWSRSGSSIAH